MVDIYASDFPPRFAVPGSDQGLSLKTGTICPLNAPESKIYVMENTPENVAAIKGDDIVRLNKDNAYKRREQRRESQSNQPPVDPDIGHESDERAGQRTTKATTGSNFHGGMGVV